MSKAVANAITSALKAVNKMGNYVMRGVQSIGKTLDDAATAIKQIGLKDFVVDIDGKRYIKSKKTGKMIEFEKVFDPNKPPDTAMTRLADILDESEMKTVQDAITGSGKSIDELTDGLTQSKAYQASKKQKTKAQTKYDNLETADGQGKFNNDVKKLVGKTALLAGVTYALCSGLAAKLNGCYLVDSATGERIQKLSGGESTCSCGKLPPDSAEGSSVYSEHAAACDYYCTSVEDPEPGVQTNWAQCDTSCACKTKEGKTSSQQYEFEWVNMDAWDVFTDTLANAGYFVTDVVEEGIDIAKEAVEAVAGALKYWWIFLIVGVVAVGLGLGIHYGMAAKKKKNSSSSSRSVKGGGSQLYEFYPTL
jgi:hypothetical protein